MEFGMRGFAKEVLVLRLSAGAWISGYKEFLI